MAGQPPEYRRTVVRAQVVQDDMQRLAARRRAVEAPEKRHKFLGAMPPPTFADHDAVQDPQRRVQRRGPMSHVIMGLPFRDARPQRQHRPRAIERLNPALLIHAEYDRFLRRIQVQPDDIAQCLDEVRVRRQCEAADAMWLKPVLAPNLADRTVADPLRLRQRATTPMRRRWGAGSQRRFDNGLHVLRRDLFAPSRTRGISHQSRQPVGDKSVRPQPHGHPTDVQGGRDSRRRFMVGQHQHDPSAGRHFLRRFPLSDDLCQLGLLRRRHVDAERLNGHAPPYQAGSAKYSVFCTATSYSRD